jgi:hypothetical protein
MTPIASLPSALQGWQNFYALTGTAAATLTGLMFVAVTFGAGLVTKETAAAARAFLDPTYIHFVQVLFTACLLVIPTMGPTLLGALLIPMGALRLLGLFWIYARYREAHRRGNSDIELSDWLSAIVAPLLTHGLLVVTGVGFLLHDALALSGLAIVTLSLLAIGIYGAWELVVWMALAVGERRRGSGVGAGEAGQASPDGSALASAAGKVPERKGGLE